MGKRHYDPAVHDRRSMRLPAYDYSSEGAYYVTFCLQERRPLLENAELCKILEEVWNALPQRFPCVVLDEFIIMTDHVHFIVWLTSHEPGRPSLANVVGAYKSLTGRAALEHMRMEGGVDAKRFWQRGYYEHVIRGELDLQEKRAYIRNNPIKEDLRSGRL